MNEHLELTELRKERDSWRSGYFELEQGIAALREDYAAQIEAQGALAEILREVREERDALREFADRYMALADRATKMHHFDRDYQNTVVLDVCRIKSQYQRFRALTEKEG